MTESAPGKIECHKFSKHLAQCNHVTNARDSTFGVGRSTRRSTQLRACTCLSINDIELWLASRKRLTIPILPHTTDMEELEAMMATDAHRAPRDERWSTCVA
jgi:hypothetical protein